MYSSSSADGEIAITFDADPIATKYKVTLFESGEVQEETEVTDLENLTYTFTNLMTNTYDVEVASFNGTEYLEPQRLEGVEVGIESSGSGW